MFKGTKNIIVFEQRLHFVLIPHCPSSVIRSIQSVQGFKQALKTLLFRLAFAQ